MRKAGLWGAAASLALLCACSAPVLPGLTYPDTRAIAVVPVDQGRARQLISSYRESHGLPAVASDATLQRVAQAQADAMASHDLLSHTVAGPLPSRLAASHAIFRAEAENVSAGYHDLEAALSGWRRSRPHDANLLFRPIRRIGLAAAAAPGTRYKTFWALVMTD